MRHSRVAVWDESISSGVCSEAKKPGLKGRRWAVLRENDGRTPRARGVTWCVQHTHCFRKRAQKVAKHIFWQLLGHRGPLHTLHVLPPACGDMHGCLGVFQSNVVGRCRRFHVLLEEVVRFPLICGLGGHCKGCVAGSISAAAAETRGLHRACAGDVALVSLQSVQVRSCSEDWFCFVSGSDCCARQSRPGTARWLAW